MNRRTVAAFAHKNVPLYFCPYLCQLLTDFQNSFTGTLCGQFFGPPCSAITHSLGTAT